MFIQLIKLNLLKRNLSFRVHLVRILVPNFLLIVEDDIVFTAVGTIGQVGIILNNQKFKKYIISNKQLRLTVDKNLVIPIFVYYWFASPAMTEIIIQRNTGSSVPLINLSVLKSLNIPVPPLPAQKAIAETLSSLDDKIDLLHRQNKTLEQMAETLFRQWFVVEAKEDWETKSLGEILSISSSKRIFYKEYVDSGIPFYRSKEIIELSKGGSTSTELFISEERFNEINSKFGSPKQGDILLTSVGTLGISYRVREDDKFYFKDGNLTWFSDFQVLPSAIIYCWLNSSVGKEELNNITIGSTQAALTISGLRQIEINFPPKEVINKLSNDLEAFYSKIEFNQKQIRKIEKIRDTLLPKLMSGEVTVKI